MIRFHPIGWCLCLASLALLGFSTCSPSIPSDDTLPNEASGCLSFQVERFELVEQVNNQFTPLDVDLYSEGATHQILVSFDAPEALTVGCWWAEGRLELSTSSGYNVYSVLDVPVTLQSGVKAEVVLEVDAGLEGFGSDVFGYANLTFHGVDGRVLSGSADLRFNPRTATTPPQSNMLACPDVWKGGRTVSLGHGDDFEVISEQSPAELRYGFQGSAMITPRVQLDNPEELDSACYNVQLKNSSIQGASLRGGAKAWLQFNKDASGALATGHIYDALGGDESTLLSAPISVEVTILGSGLYLQKSFTVPIANDL